MRLYGTIKGQADAPCCLREPRKPWADPAVWENIILRTLTIIDSKPVGNTFW
jgi:hypothetical protein